jgi:eukaryotic-like serine/threonine-protein kinase
MSQKFGDAGYRIIEPIASGGMGQVFKAEHVITKRIEAVKLLSGAGTKEETERFLREIQLQASLSHPNIAAVYNAFSMENDLVMVMELVEGEPLRNVLQRGRLAPEFAIRYACQVLGALSYAHEHGVIHRDVSPSNIVITPQGSVKLMDFGLAKASASPSSSLSGTYMGSPHYMSPEQVKDARQASAQSDIYSLGAVLYEMVTGRTVFESDSSFGVMQAQVEKAPKPPVEINPAIGPAVNTAILTALAKDPAQRFPNADAFRLALEGSIRTALPVAQVKPQPRRMWIRPVLMFTATCAMILLPTGLYIKSRRHAPAPVRTTMPAAVLPRTAPASVNGPPTLKPRAVRTERPSIPVSRKRPARRQTQSDTEPVVVEIETPPAAAVHGMEPGHPAPSGPPPAVPPARASEPEAPAASSTGTQIADAAREEQADGSKNRKPHGKFRRALGKIFSPFRSASDPK